MKGTIIFADTFTPTAKQLHDCPHVVLSSPHEWNPQQVTFRNKSCSFKDEIEQYYNISAINSQRNIEAVNNGEMFTVYDIATINDRLLTVLISKTLL